MPSGNRTVLSGKSEMDVKIMLDDEGKVKIDVIVVVYCHPY